MKKWLTGTLLVALIALAGCTPSIYGVPQDRWETMGEMERVATMEAYRTRQEVLRQQQAERARLRAIEQERQRAIEAEEARQRLLRVDAIYRGEGVYGDLLRVTVQEGRMKLHGSQRAYHPVTFRIAAGETKEVQVVDLKGGRASTLVFGYDGSTLLLDDRPGKKPSPAAHLAYEDAWEEGKSYTGFSTRGPLQLSGVTVTVKVLGEPPRARREGRRPQVIVIQQPVPAPADPKVGAPGRGSEHRPKNPEVIVVSPPPNDRQNTAFKEKPERHRSPDAPPPRLKVTFRKGKIQVRGKNFPINPQSIELRDGEVRTVSLQGRFGKVKLLVSFQGGTIAIDDHPGKGGPATRLSFSKDWRAGSTYLIKATENRVVEDLDLFIQAL